MASGVCEGVIWCAKRDSADVIKGKDFEIEYYPELSVWAQSGHTSPSKQSVFSGWRWKRDVVEVRDF